MLQEVCYTQYLGVRARLIKLGYSAVFAAAATGGRCDDFDRRHGTGFGVAIVARGTLAGRVVQPLPSPSAMRAERRVLLGATLRRPGRSVFVATTHTAPGGPNLTAQLAALQRYLTPIAATRPVIFGGDLNALPDNTALAGFYRLFREADGSRAHPLPTFATVPRKIDYLFAGRWFTPRGATVAATRYSDHRMYLGAFG
jgi:endonuclease/exonuclease/phosphatase family metal-dependent hydrolase